MAELETIKERPIRGAIFWSLIGGGLSLVLFVRDVHDPLLAALAVAICVALAPAYGWGMYLFVFRFIFGMVRILPFVGPRFYTAVDLLLHGKNVAELNAKSDTLRDEEIAARYRRERLWEEYNKTPARDRAAGLRIMEEIEMERARERAAAGLQNVAIDRLGQFSDEQVLLGAVHDEVASKVEQAAQKNGDQ